MKKILAIITIATLFNGLANADGTERDNKVCFNMPIESFTIIDDSITNGQTLDGVSKDSEDKQCLIVSAGRKQSSEIVDWVKDKIEKNNISWNEGNMTPTTTLYQSMPTELNFAIQLNMTFRDPDYVNFPYICNNLILGQGSPEAGEENWWLFSNNNYKKHNISCDFKTIINQPEFLKVSGSQLNTFKLAL